MKFSMTYVYMTLYMHQISYTAYYIRVILYMYHIVYLPHYIWILLKPHNFIFHYYQRLQIFFILYALHIIYASYSIYTISIYMRHFTYALVVLSQLNFCFLWEVRYIEILIDCFVMIHTDVVRSIQISQWKRKKIFRARISRNYCY